MADMSNEAREAKRAYSRAYYAANKERIRAYHKAWRQKNADRVKGYSVKHWERKAAEMGVK